MGIAMLDEEGARWARFCIREKVELLRVAAMDARRHGQRNVVAARAANHIADSYDRAARELLRALDDINPQPGKMHPAFRSPK